MLDQRDYYKILDVSPEASFSDIKAAYYTQLKTLKKHPDLGGSHEEAVALNEAYEILGDPDKRKAYHKRYFGSSPWTSEDFGKNPVYHGAEKRQARRHPFFMSFRIRLPSGRSWSPAQFRDISLLGACFRSAATIRTGDMLEMAFLEDQSGPVLARMRWVRKIPQRFGASIYEGGVEFHGTDPETLRNYLTKQKIGGGV